MLMLKTNFNNSFFFDEKTIIFIVLKSLNPT